MLSTEEMREKIEKYCKDQPWCKDCPLDGHSSCFTCNSSKEIEENYKILVNANRIEEDKITQKHLKGYIFDSLMYRYQLARERQLMYEIAKEGVDPVTARHRFESDVIRFREILDEAMGEHD